MSKYILEIMRDERGFEFASLSKEGAGCGYRIAGAKPCGHSNCIARLTITKKDLYRYIVIIDDLERSES